MRIAIVVGAFLLVSGCICDCDLDDIVDARAGAGAIDCGFVPLGADLGPTLDCIEAAIADGVPVRAGWQSQGRDSEVRTYLAGHDGSFSMFGYDGDPSGGSNACPRFTDVPCDSTPARFTDASGREVFSCPGSRSLPVCDR